MMGELIMWALSGGFWRFIGFVIIVSIFLRAVLYLVAILLNREWVEDKDKADE